MDRFRPLLIIAVLSCCALTARAQGGEVGLGLDPSLMTSRSKKSKTPSMKPLSLALSLVFDATTWAQVGISTAAPAGDLAAFFDHGFYRLELIQLTLMARASGRKLSDLTKMRGEKKELRTIAEDLSLKYDDVYAESLTLAKEVDMGIEAVSRVRPMEAVHE